jgi:alanine racemase
VVAGGANTIAVADIADAVRLRDHGIRTPVLLYAGNLADRAAVEVVESQRLMPTILDRESAEIYAAHAQTPIRVFIKIDVGLERLGVLPGQAAALARQVRGLRNLELHGVYTHVDVPDDPKAEEYVAWQVERYRAVCKQIEAEGGAIPVKMAASSAVLRCDPNASFDAVDPGHMLFGLTPPGPLNVGVDLRPAFHSLSSRIIHARSIEREHFLDLAPFPLREGMRFGIIPIGLRDGMAALNCGEVLVGGRRAAILGPLSLEHTRVDLSGTPEAKVGDEVVIIGRQGEAVIEPEAVVAHQGFGVKAALALAAGGSIPREYV